MNVTQNFLEDNLLSTEDVAKMLRITQQQVRNLARNGNIPIIFIASHKLFFLRKDVGEYITKHPYVSEWNKNLPRTYNPSLVEMYPDYDRPDIEAYLSTHYTTVMDASRAYGLPPQKISYALQKEKYNPAFSKGGTSFYYREQIETLAVLAKRSEYVKGYECCKRDMVNYIKTNHFLNSKAVDELARAVEP